MNWNLFRILADLLHISSKCILIWAIHRNRSSEGVSFLTQLLYAIVFVTRYLDLIEASQWSSWYLVFFKIFYILSSFYILFLMTTVFPRTREKEKAWKFALFSVAGSAAAAPLVILLYKSYPYHWILEVFWAFSIILESVCVLPQLLLLRQTTVPTVIDSYYLVTLGSYRALYILNWMVRGFGPEHFWDPIADVFGVIQTILYIDFAWVYYSRQRVKLRNGCLIDSEDIQKGWLIGSLLNSRVTGSVDEEQPLDGDARGLVNGRRSRTTANRWGARGISVSADDLVEEDLSNGQARAQLPDGPEQIVNDASVDSRRH